MEDADGARRGWRRGKGAGAFSLQVERDELARRAANRRRHLGEGETLAAAAVLGDRAGKVFLDLAGECTCGRMSAADLAGPVRHRMRERHLLAYQQKQRQQDVDNRTTDHDGGIVMPARQLRNHYVAFFSATYLPSQVGTLAAESLLIDTSSSGATPCKP